jgi:hypothetical protein
VGIPTAVGTVHTVQVGYRPKSKFLKGLRQVGEQHAQAAAEKGGAFTVIQVA